MGSTRYITSMGELSRKDNSLCFRKDGKNVYIPIENTKEIYCLNEISINTKLLDFLARNDIVVHFFNYFEGYSGTFYSTFKYFLPEDFIMNKRVKRPPDNPINSYLYFMMLEKNVCKRFLKFVKNTYHIFKNRYLEGR